jgi:hypothetical protein
VSSTELVGVAVKAYAIIITLTHSKTLFTRTQTHAHSTGHGKFCGTSLLKAFVLSRVYDEAVEPRPGPNIAVF